MIYTYHTNSYELHIYSYIYILLVIYFNYILFNYIYLINALINYLYYIIIDFIYTNHYKHLLTRVIKINQNTFDEDSENGRINNPLYALRISEPYYFVLGKGLNGEFRFFDGIHSIFIAIGGFSLLFLLIVNVILIIGKIIFVNKINSYKILFLIFLFFLIISNLITEFIFVTRWMIPIISLSTMLYFYSFKNKQIKMKNVT